MSFAAARPRRAQEPRVVVARDTSRHLLSQGQWVALLLVLAGYAVAFGSAPRQTLSFGVVTPVVVFTFVFVAFKALLMCGAFRYARVTRAAAPPLGADAPDLPSYTVFIPLYHEANMLPSLVEAIKRLQYPPQLLQVLLLLEESDLETRAEAVATELPEFFDVVLTPDCPPRGKPKALNMGLAEATGEFCVIYDAEDRPDPDQLLKAVSAFRRGGERLACVQARLDFWNESSSWITRFYKAEYIVHFQWVLPGLSALGLIPPLGGTSNHFRTRTLRDIAIAPDRLPQAAQGVGGWDPWNVTEDAELAGALAVNGYRIRMIDSVTSEEATAGLGVADRQRRRWLKGYTQTGLNYARRPLPTARRMGLVRWAAYLLLMLGTPLSLLLSPVFWVLSVAYVLTGHNVVGELVPFPLFWAGLALTVVGNGGVLLQFVVACARFGSRSSIKYMLLAPLWWAFTSYSCFRMLPELGRQVWNKTQHGHDLDREVVLASGGRGDPSVRSVFVSGVASMPFYDRWLSRIPAPAR